MARRRSRGSGRFTFAIGVVALAFPAMPTLAAGTDAQRAKAAPCEACHGVEGRSTMPDVPSLAGQPKQFITTQLVMFREENRKSPVMNALAAPLTNADIDTLGGYFAAQAPAPPSRTLGAEATAAARAIAEGLGCVTCHGADLRGQQHIPRLAGQQADYLRAQLIGFKAGTRFDMDGNMTSAAQALTPADIETLATYLGTLR